MASPFTRPEKPDTCIGVGLRHLHYDDALAHSDKSAPIDFVEIHAENFFAKGGITRALLIDVREKYELSIHGTSLGLGSELPLPKDTLNKFSALVKAFSPQLVSEHLCFNRANIDGHVYHSGDLLPLAYNARSLKVIVDNIAQLQEAIQRPVLIENLSAYLSPHDLDKSDSALDDMSEFEFLQAMCKASGCGLLLDINNLIVNALNQGVDDVHAHVLAQIQSLPPNIIGEVHLAGFSEQRVGGFIIDNHGQAVSQQCWDIYQAAQAHLCSQSGASRSPVPTLIEWDTNLPDWQTLVQQSQIARQLA